LFPTSDSGSLIGFGVGTRGLSPDEVILTKPGHRRELDPSFGRKDSLLDVAIARGLEVSAAWRRAASAAAASSTAWPGPLDGPVLSRA